MDLNLKVPNYNNSNEDKQFLEAQIQIPDLNIAVSDGEFAQIQIPDLNVDPEATLLFNLNIEPPLESPTDQLLDYIPNKFHEDLNGDTAIEDLVHVEGSQELSNEDLNTGNLSSHCILIFKHCF